ncbi:MAG: hypothetical protein E7588_06185 [Ruminococcaceae bacterium]|nr:hypothetical protein [Oscillospiraceae bacterium]
MDLQTTTIAYICPACGSTVTEDINIFSLSGGHDVACRCGEALNIKVSHDRKITLSVPCLACPDNHTTRLSSASFFSRELFTVQCPYTALDICYIGQREKVEKAMAENKKYLEETFAQEKGEAEEDVLKEAYDMYENPMVMNDVLLLLRDFITDGRIHCDCGGFPGMEKLRVDINRVNVVITCTACGKKRIVRALTENDVIYLCETDILELNQ